MLGTGNEYIKNFIQSISMVRFEFIDSGAMVIYQAPVTGQHQINLQFEDLIQAGQIMF